jgi:flagellar secretion chaperone FliS
MQQASYLESKVLTATPQRLHLMLIDGAIRFGRQAEEALRRNEPETAVAPFTRVIDIVGEMLAGVRMNKTEMNKRLADVYWFLFRRISAAKINSDLAALAEAIQILEYERQTWQLVCEKFGGAAALPGPHSRAFEPGDLRTAKTGVSWQA